MYRFSLAEIHIWGICVSNAAQVGVPCMAVALGCSRSVIMLDVQKIQVLSMIVCRIGRLYA